MSRRNVGLVELLVELVEHHGILILRVTWYVSLAWYPVKDRLLDSSTKGASATLTQVTF
jgi:hypothetical protein